ncbi:MAG: hypothetical protein M0Z41_15190 [Peptococcaceae bacterium]|nr:hypothetical protein [Peptococcaceae bacterium]
MKGIESVMSYTQIVEQGKRDKALAFYLENGTTFYIDEDYCTNPTCGCNHVLLRFLDVRTIQENAKAAFSFRLDIETGKITDREINNKRIGANRLIDEFVNDLDNETLDRFRQHLSQAKQYGRQHYLDYIPEQVMDAIAEGDITPHAAIFGSADMGALAFQCSYWVEGTPHGVPAPVVAGQAVFSASGGPDPVP